MQVIWIWLIGAYMYGTRVVSLQYSHTCSLVAICAYITRLLLLLTNMNIDTPPDSRVPQTSFPVDPTITQCLAYLQSPSDTSRFVGLAVLSSILKNQHIAQDQVIVRKFWDSMPYKFLDRLLISRMSSP